MAATEPPLLTSLASDEQLKQSTILEGAGMIKGSVSSTSEFRTRLDMGDDAGSSEVSTIVACVDGDLGRDRGRMNQSGSGAVA
ncbi:hypothetical protein IL306_008091, partial [Fusarium sp. DS 682]